MSTKRNTKTNNDEALKGVEEQVNEIVVDDVETFYPSDAEPEYESIGQTIVLIFNGVDEGDSDILNEVIEAVIDEGIKRGLFFVGASTLPLPDRMVSDKTDFYKALQDARKRESNS